MFYSLGHEFSMKQTSKSCSRHSLHDVASLVSITLIAFIADPVVADDDFEKEPISYSEVTPNDRVAQLIAQVKAGKLDLAFDPEFGYLPALIDQLDVPLESQMLVFSKTSLQLHFITPKNPRAIYFNDDIYIGYVPGGEVIEISATDPVNGAMFYTLNQPRSNSPLFVRQTGQCLQCHGTGRTANVPGHLVRSMLTDPEGNPLYSTGVDAVTHDTPVSRRWAGWYVTGTHGDERHFGNLWLNDRDIPENEIDREAGANAMDLSAYLDVSRYPSPHSDIVALMVMEHQVQMHNLITRANYRVREALHWVEQTDNQNNADPVHHRNANENLKRVIETQADALLRYMLFLDEPSFNGPIQGTSGYQKWFESKGITDAHGRSLRTFDLEHQLFKYPCSYLIYSDAFDQLPKPLLEHVYRRLFEILTATDRESHGMAAFSTDMARRDREAVLEILRSTKKGLPEYWHDVPVND